MTNPLQANQSVATTDLNLITVIPDELLQGTTNSEFSQTDLQNIYQTFPRSTTAIEGTKTYYDFQGSPYHYEFWLSEGGTQDQKAWNFTNDNQNALYGAPLTAHVSATLVWGPAKEESI
ncbi:MAG: hypothetical protein ABF756_09270 [Liquorilactobacillus ghanensis]|uniref:hypothetical protein n=1 Tax=Liquorilactobacillus ghanensis TaxID=399370 RepID=UPI0039E88C3A